MHIYAAKSFKNPTVSCVWMNVCMDLAACVLQGIHFFKQSKKQQLETSLRQIYLTANQGFQSDWQLSMFAYVRQA